MASMKRNLNLEEIDTDSILGIEFLRYQSLLQKVILIGSAVCSLIVMFGLSIAAGINSFLSTFLALPIIGAGVLFGCNYNQDFSLYEYLVFSLKDEKDAYGSDSPEDIYYLRAHKNEILGIRQTDELDEEEIDANFKKMLFRIILIGAIAIIFLIVAFIIGSSDDEVEIIHHEVSGLIEIYTGRSV